MTKDERMTESERRNAGRPPTSGFDTGASFVIRNSSFVISLRHIRKRHIRRHAGAEFAFAIVQPHLDAKDLLDAFADGLHIARRELSLAGDLLDHTRKILARIGVHADLDGLIELDV